MAPGRSISGLEDEYNLASNMPKLIYIKIPAPEREPGLASLLERIRDDNTCSYTYFSTQAQLKQLVQDDLALMLAEGFESIHRHGYPGIQQKPFPQTNLPFPRNSLVGREHELASLCELVLRQDVALVTLTGPGGTGKSRLAIQIGLELLERFQDGVFLVGLESIHDPHLVIPTIAETFGIRETSTGRPTAEILSEYLQGKQLLLVLDNFEHLMDAAPCVSALLESCPNLKCIVTSRAPLRLRAEKEVSVSPLKASSTQEPISIDELSEYAAASLFIQRAQDINPNFQVTAANATAIAEICKQFDGLPLAIELAAARIKLLPPPVMLSRLKHRFDLLTVGSRDLPERQRTLRSTIDWSYNLLNNHEKKLFRRLAVFSGGWTLDAPGKMCDIEGDLLPQLEDTLALLIDNNLVVQVTETEEEAYFMMLRTIQSYADELLSVSEEHDAIHEQHARFYLDFASQVEPRIRTAERIYWQQVMQREFSNIRGVLEWIQKKEKFIDIGQRLVITLGLYWQTCGFITEGLQWCEKMLAFCDDLTPAGIQAGLLCYKALLIRSASGQPSPTEIAEKSIELSRQQDNKSLLGNALLIGGIVALSRHDPDTASAYISEAIEIFNITGELWNEVIALAWSGDVAYYQNDPGRAVSLHSESIRLGRLQGDPWCLMPALMSAAQIEILAGDLDNAYSKLTEVVDVLQKTGDRWNLAWTLIDLCHVALLQDKVQQAGAYLLEGLTMASSFGNRRALIIALAEAAAIIARKTQPGNTSGLGLAAQLCGATLPYINIPGVFLWINNQNLYEDSINLVKSSMEITLWDQTHAIGQALTMDQAINLATQALRPS